MTSHKFDPTMFFRRSDAVAALAAGAELFSLLKRSIELPPQWAALIRDATGDHRLIRPGGTVDGREAREVLFARTTPVEVEIAHEGVLSSDQYQCRAEALLRIALIPDRSDLVSFQSSVLGSERFATGATIRKFIESCVHGTLAAVAENHEASSLVDGDVAAEASSAVRKALEPALFSAGLTLKAAPSLRFESTALTGVRRAQEASIRSRHEHQARREVQQAIERSQAEHLDHVGGLLSRLNELAAASPEVELVDLIKTFPQTQRGELYEALLPDKPVGSSTRWVVVAAGDELLFYDASSLDRPARRFTLAGSAGSVRSVQFVQDGSDEGALLIGAAQGIYRMPLSAVEPDLTLAVPVAPSVRGGFNSAIMVGSRVYGSHSELGLWVWDTAGPATGRALFESMTRDAKAVRGVCALADHLYCAIDDRLIRWPVDGGDDRPEIIFTGSRARISAVCPSSLGLFAGNSDGDILHWPDDRPGEPQRIHGGSHRPAESLALVSSGGIHRLFFTDTSIYAHARVPGDSFTCRFEAGGQTLRRVDVADDLIVATTDLRDRLLCWAPNRPQRTIAQVGVSALTQRSVQDVCLVPRT
jgi:hypothetical protein